MPAPFDIELAIERIREAVRSFPRAMLFELYDDGHTSPFEMLVACLISVRTRDETSLVMAQALFARARTPAEMAELDINAMLVPFGKNICTPIGPRCSMCPLLDMCAQRGVTSSR